MADEPTPAPELTAVPAETLTPEEIRRLLATRPVESPYLDIDQAAEYCRVAKQTLYNRRRELERVPGTRKLIFRREVLDRWLATRRKR